MDGPEINRRYTGRVVRPRIEGEQITPSADKPAPEQPQVSRKLMFMLLGVGIAGLLVTAGLLVYRSMNKQAPVAAAPVDTTKYLKIPEFNLQLVLSDDIADATYYILEEEGIKYIALSTWKLAVYDPGCSAETGGFAHIKYYSDASADAAATTQPANGSDRATFSQDGKTYYVVTPNPDEPCYPPVKATPEVKELVQKATAGFESAKIRKLED